MTPDDFPTPEDKQARLTGLIATGLYLALFFPSFYIFMLAGLFEHPEMSGTIGVILVFLSAACPLSIVAGIGLIWNRYFRKDYKGVYISCTIPIIATIIIVVLMKLIEWLFL